MTFDDAAFSRDEVSAADRAVRSRFPGTSVRFRLVDGFDPEGALRRVPLDGELVKVDARGRPLLVGAAHHAAVATRVLAFTGKRLPRFFGFFWRRRKRVFLMWLEFPLFCGDSDFILRRASKFDDDF